jgi:hypothetical protein
MESSSKITYITRDIERAIGIDPSSDYHIIANKTPYADKIALKFPDHIQLISSDTILGTRELMEQAHTSNLLPQGSVALVFKNTARVEEAAAKTGLTIVNPKASLSETIENKMSQVEWLGELGKKYLPSHVVMPTKKVTWTGEPFILQWAHGHTGGGTVLVSSEAELKAIQTKFPYRMARRSVYIKGPSFTVNAIVAADRILVGNVSYQITGIKPFTDNAFSTVGNDWAVAHTLLDPSELEYIETMTRDIGKKLNISGWRGLYGVDIIRDDVSKKIYLIEINARQPASTTFESSLQKERRSQGARGLTTFEAHLRALLGKPIDQDLIPITDGAQIVQRVTSITKSIPENIISALESDGYRVATYPNTDMNEDLVRIQSDKGIMESHNEFNSKGKEILKIISN